MENRDMANWLDEFEQKKKREEQEYDAKMEGIYADIRQASAKQEALVESIKHLVDPVFAQLETHTERAKRNGFYLWIRKNEYWHNLTIHRMEKDYASDDKYRNSLAHVTLSPRSNGLEVTFVRSKTEFSFVQEEYKSTGKWHEESIDYSSQTIGTVPYDSLTDDDLLNVVKWIATGAEPIPSFRNVVPYQPPYKLEQIKTRGCRAVLLMLLFGLVILLVMSGLAR
jgi:hypothetical protein